MACVRMCPRTRVGVSTYFGINVKSDPDKSRRQTIDYTVKPRRMIAGTRRAIASESNTTCGRERNKVDRARTNGRVKSRRLSRLKRIDSGIPDHFVMRREPVGRFIGAPFNTPPVRRRPLAPQFSCRRIADSAAFNRNG